MRGVEQIPWLYDACCALIERFGLGRWRRWLVEGAAGRALDVGCGTGRNLPLYGVGVRVIGLHPARDALLAAPRPPPGGPPRPGGPPAPPVSGAPLPTLVPRLV